MSRLALALLVAGGLGAVTLGAAQSADPKVLEIQRLKRLNSLINPDAHKDLVAIGQPVPDFTLKDQQGTSVALSSLKGKAIALTFGYIRCANPAYCFRLASNLGQLQRRFQDRLGGDLILLSVMLDPQRDQGRALADYAAIWTSQPSVWHFLTGPLPDVKRVAGYFGVEFWKDEGSVVHSLNTAVIDRQGRLAANVEGNALTQDQLVELVSNVLTTR